MRITEDRDDLTQRERFSEVAAILAAAVARLHLRAALPLAEVGVEKPPESGPNCLEIASETRLSVHRG